MSNDVIVDCIAAKNLMDKLAVQLVNDGKHYILNGYIQEISLDPFGFLVTSDIQVFKILKIVYYQKYYIFFFKS